MYSINSLDDIEKIESTEYTHNDTYLICEAVLELDDLFNKFLYFHMKLIGRSIGLQAHSMKGNVVTNLTNRIARSLYPELWEIRSKMTSEWGIQYGIVRESLSSQKVM